MADIHERSHRQYPHDMALAAVWEQGYITALADLRAKVEGLGHWIDCEAYEDLNEGSDYGNENIRETGEPCSCLIGEFLALIEEAGG